MGDGAAHNQESMRFVFAGSKYLKTHPNGRYVNFVGRKVRHERALLSICEAMGVTDFSGFGDSTLGAEHAAVRAQSLSISSALVDVQRRISAGFSGKLELHRDVDGNDASEPLRRSCALWRASPVAFGHRDTATPDN
jgi:hypothetical protein